MSSLWCRRLRAGRGAAGRVWPAGLRQGRGGGGGQGEVKAGGLGRQDQGPRRTALARHSLPFCSGLRARACVCVCVRTHRGQSRVCDVSALRSRSAAPGASPLARAAPQVPPRLPPLSLPPRPPPGSRPRLRSDHGTRACSGPRADGVGLMACLRGRAVLTLSQAVSGPPSAPMPVKRLPTRQPTTAFISAVCDTARTPKKRRSTGGASQPPEESPKPATANSLEQNPHGSCRRATERKRHQDGGGALTSVGLC